MNERPVCHRAEDLVTYLYGEANGDEAQDFATHMQQCDACRAEFSVFNEVHDSVVLWRNEALGMAFTPAAQKAASPAVASVNSGNLVQHQRKLSALAALREFFSVSPLWLRGATALAAMLLCALGVLAVLQLKQKPAVVVKSNEKVYTPQQVEAIVNERVNRKVADMRGQQEPEPVATPKKKQSNDSTDRIQLASYPQSKTPVIKALSRKERLQLAADLQLIPGRDESEFPFVFTDEPEQ